MTPRAFVGGEETENMLVTLPQLRDSECHGNGLFTSRFAYNGEFDIWGRNAPYNQAYFDLGPYGSYGVCDGPQQLMSRMGDLILSDPRPFVVLFDHVTKDPDNIGIGGGWRWHKWGDYIGNGSPTCEHLDDEKEFPDGVWVYHVYDVTGQRIIHYPESPA